MSALATQDSARAANLKSRKILHIDDDVKMTDLVGAKLRQSGYEVDSLNDERLWEQKLALDSQRVVLLDLEMPYISGGQILRNIKKYDGTIQVIILTSHVRLFVILDSLRDGAEYCFFKPITDFQPLLTALDATHARLEHWRSAVTEARRELLKLREPTTGYRGAGLKLAGEQT